MKRNLAILALLLIAVTVGILAQNTANYMEQGGAKWVVGGLLQFGTTTTPAVYLGGGTNASPLTTSTVDKNFADFRTQTTATSGSSRGIYWKHFLADTTPSGETARFFTEVDTAGATDAHGAHISLSYGTNGTCTGESAALRATLQIPNKTLGGTNGAGYFELFADGSSSNASNAQFARFVLAGDGTGVTALNTSSALFSIEGVTIGSAGDGKVVDAISGDKAVTHLTKVRINGANYWIMLRNAE